MAHSWNQEVSLLTPFFHLPRYRNWDEACLVADLEEPLRQLLPPPKGVEVRHVTRIPNAWPSEQQSPSNDPIRPVHAYESERVAPAELARVLRLVQAGKVKVTDSAGRPTDATVRLIGESLVVPDFEVEIPENARSDWDRRHYTAAGPVRAHSWPVLLQQCGWARAQGGTLTLTSDGRSILGDFSPDKVRAGLSRFLANDDFDELNRIHHIKGQSGKGRRSIRQPSQRKFVVAGALKSCPPGEWVAFSEMSRLVDSLGENWDVLKGGEGPALYFFEPQFGWISDNRGLCRQFLRALLMESLATLGLFDVAFIYPHRLWPDLKDSLWGDLDFCGRYDGLLYVRMNALGAYAFGLSDRYEVAVENDAKLFQILPNLDLHLRAGELNPADRATLELMAISKGGREWTLDAERILTHVETGGSLRGLLQFLEQNASEPLPGEVLAWFGNIWKRIEAPPVIHHAILLEWPDDEMARMVSTHDSTRGLCFHAGQNRIVVPKSKLNGFRAAIKKLGFVVPQMQGD